MRRRSVRVAVALAVVLALGCTTADARSLRVLRTTALSSASPFPISCGGVTNSGRGHELEPALAAAPTNPRRIAGLWLQDDMEPSATEHALGQLSAITRDDTKTFRRRIVTGLTACAGGPQTLSHTLDPGIGIGPLGRVYAGGLACDPQANCAMRVAHSDNGGASWKAVEVVPPGPYDGARLTVERRKPGQVYATWSKFEGSGPVPTAYPPEFSRSRDGGVTWSPSRRVYTPPSAQAAPIQEIVALPDGALVDIVFQIPFAALSTAVVPGDTQYEGKVIALHSPDRGNTWSQPITVGSYPVALHKSSDGYQAFPAPPRVALAPDGTIYVVWPQHEPGFTASTLQVAASTDRGASWSEPRPVERVPAYAFLNNIAVARDGTLAVSWDDYRKDHSGDSQETTDVWLSHSHDQGRTWHRMHIAGPFDSHTAKSDLGDSQGLVPAGDHGFALAFAAAKPLAHHGITDVFLARIVRGG